jgi:dephospho-CoA kinase
MKVIALTGSVAAGKSTVAELFRRWGTPVIDADRIVRDLQRPGEAVYHAMVARFGPTILLPDDTLDRTQVRRMMLTSPATKRDLEAIVHPAVEHRRQELLESARVRGEPLVVADIPLLFEAADPTRYDGVIVVDAPVAIRRRRLIEDRGYHAEEADQLMSAQLPPEAKRARANWIIENDADRATLEARARRVWEALPR